MGFKQIFKTSTFFVLGLSLLVNSCKKDKNTGLVKDIDGNVYHTVTIGTQVWMVENLKTTRYRNGDEILYAENNQGWLNIVYPDGVYSNYDFNDENGEIYGHLYNWNAVNNPDPEKKLAPEGWHIPTKEEWETLINYLGGQTLAGGKLKQKGSLYWESSNNVSAEEYGFNALPSGYIYFDNGATSFDLKTRIYLWSASEINNESAFFFSAYSNNETADYQITTSKRDGLAVRCIKDY